MEERRGLDKQRGLPPGNRFSEHQKLRAIRDAPLRALPVDFSSRAEKPILKLVNHSALHHS
jgi:hypothetical protein